MGENGIIALAKKTVLEQKKQIYYEEIRLEILEEKAERTINQKTELFIVSLEKRIQGKTWVKETINEDIMLIVETKDKYEIIIDVDNVKEIAVIRDNYFSTDEREETVITAQIETSSLKLTEGTTIEINGTSNIGIDKVEVFLGETIIYSELPGEGKEVIESPYTKILEIKDINLTNLEFHELYTPKIIITAKTENKEAIQVQKITNYTIGNANALKKLATEVNNGTDFNQDTILQVENINLDSICGENEENWTPIGRYHKISETDRSFNGIYNGNNKNINNLYINTTESGTLGLFGYSIGTIINVKVEGEIKRETSPSQGSAMGGICGFNEGTIMGSENRVEVTGSTRSGGICGNNNGGIIQNCTNYATISDKVFHSDSTIQGTGGIAGVGRGTITNCRNEGEISGQISVGGIIGLSGYQAKCNVSQCTNIGNITSDTTVVGGIVAHNLNGDVTECSNSGTITGSGTNTVDSGFVGAGGICAYNKAGRIFKCVNTGDVSNEDRYTGGICGANNRTSDTTVVVEQCVNSGNVSGAKNAVGGIVGRLGGGTITYCYNMSSAQISCTAQRIGGVVGLISSHGTYSTDTFTYCYNISTNITGSGQVGNIIGSTDSGMTITSNNNYYISGTAIGTQGTACTVTAITTKAQLLQDLGSSNWKIVSGKNDGYPILSWQ